MCACACVLGAVHVSTSAKEVRRGHQSPWSWSYGVGGVEEVGGMVSPLALHLLGEQHPPPNPLLHCFYPVMDWWMFPPLAIVVLL